MTTYYALTTHGGDWWVVTMGEGREATEAKAREIIGHPARDIYADTESKNLRVVPKTRAVRFFGGERGFEWAIDSYLDSEANE